MFLPGSEDSEDPKDSEDSEDSENQTCDEVPVELYLYEYLRLTYVPFAIWYFKLLSERIPRSHYNVLLATNMFESIRLHLVQTAMTGNYMFIAFGVSHCCLVCVGVSGLLTKYLRNVLH